MSLEDRRDLVIKNKLCFNCLYFGHQVSKCRFSPCPKCTKRHHEKLHTDMVEVNKAGVEADKIVCFGNVPNSHDNLNNVSKSTVSKICLATSIVYVSNINGIPQRCRAVIDSGAEISLMTVECAQRLKLPLKKSICPISGIGMTSSSTNSIVNAKLTSLHNNDYCSKLEFHVLSRITNNLPHKYFDISSFDIPESIKTQLSDPWFNVPDQIDILLGAEVSYDIFDGQKYSLPNGIVLYHTALGWVLAGKTILSSAHFNTEPLVHQTNVQSALALLTTKSESRRQEESEVESHLILRNSPACQV